MSLGFDVDAEIAANRAAAAEVRLVQTHNFRTRGIQASRLRELSEELRLLLELKAAGGGTGGMTGLAQRVAPS